MQRLAATMLLALTASFTTSLLAPCGAAAQEAEIRHTDMSRRQRARLLELVRDSATRRFDGDARVPADDVIGGNVLAMHGTLAVAGRIDGDLLLIGGTLDMQPGGFISGDVTLIDGAVQGDAPRAIAGTLIAYGGAGPGGAAGDTALGGWRSGDRSRGWHGGGPEGDWGYAGRLGRGELALRLGTYNRVEGLPIGFGPRVETAGRNPTRLTALGIWRTQSAPDNGERFGYDVTLEQLLGGRGDVRLGVGVESVVAPIETAGVSGLETSLSTLLLHQDYRDHYQREGFRAYAEWDPSPLRLSVTFRSENQSSRAAGDPWSLTRQSDTWRLQPLVAEGRLETLAAGLTLDTRRDRVEPDAWDSGQRWQGGWGWGAWSADADAGGWPDGPWSADMSSGWRLRVLATTGLGGRLAIPARENALSASPVTLAPTAVDTHFSTGIVDVRRYARVGWSSQLALRGVIAGSLSGAALPAQYQHALGGLGTLPGYDVFSGDCGARVGQYRRASGGATAPLYYPAYGCDRVALFQAEYRSGIHLDLGDWWDGGWDRGSDDTGWRDHDQDEGWRRDDRAPDIGWSVFFDAGQGWAAAGPMRPAGTHTGALYDAGIGLFIGGFGAYWAAPLAPGTHGSTFFIRLGRRF